MVALDVVVLEGFIVGDISMATASKLSLATYAVFVRIGHVVIRLGLIQMR